MSKILRSGKYPSEIGLVLDRLANHLKQPLRSKCATRFKLILQFRNQSVPKKNCPLKIPFLAHEGFRAQLQQFLHQEVRHAQPVLIPYHLPTTRPLEAPPTKVIKLPWSDVKDLPPPASPCSCQTFLRKHPKEDSINGHVVTGLETLTLPTNMQHFQEMGGANAYFDNKIRLIEKSTQTLSQRHQFPMHLDTKQRFRQFLEQQWQQHSRSLQRNPRYTVGGIKYLKSFIPTDFVVRNEDHANNRVMIYCSQVYNRAAINSWADPGVFTELSESPEQLKLQMRNHIPHSISKQQQQLVDFNKDLPYGYIMIKRKKHWNKGRTIVAYGSTCVGTLLKLAALAIQELLNSTWPCHFGHRLTPAIWKDIHRFFATTALDDNLLFLNHDLVGFFNSIPQTTILSSLRNLIQDFLSSGGAKTLMVDLHSKIGPVHSGKSRFSVRANQIELNMTQLMDIIQFSFSSGCFTTLGKCYRQVQGTSMGNQVSPILSSLSVMAYERAWLHIHSTLLSQLSSKVLVLLYVDNRAIFIHEDLLQCSGMCELASLDFYPKPIQLEDEEHNEFLGFRINPQCREVSYMIKPQKWRYRLPCSAGSHQLNLSGFRSRRQLILKFAFPWSVRCPQIQELRDVYSALGFDVSCA